ncbi:stalk domain-containing protein [Bacillus tianshenii]|nr:stalk domain-containing protein [Bacillus tianshenii]
MKKRQLTIAALCLSCMLIASPGVTDASSANNHYEQQFQYDEGIEIPDKSVLWHDAKLDNIEVSGNLVFYRQTGKVIAKHAATGKTAWTVRKATTGMKLFNNRLYLTTADGTIHVLDPSTGQASSTIKTGKQQLSVTEADDKRVYVIYKKDSNRKVAAFDLSTRKQVWEYGKAESRYQHATLKNDVLFVYTVESGAITRGVTYALNPANGEEYWGEDWLSPPITIQDGIGYFPKHPFMTAKGDELYILELIELKTGKIVDTYTYKDPEQQPDGAMSGKDMADQTGIYNGKIYLGKDETLYQYDLSINPSESKPYTYTLPGFRDVSFAFGPYNGKVFSIGNDRVYAKDLGAEFKETSFATLNPVSAMDAYDSAVYVGTTDGQFTVYNLQTGKPYYKTKMAETSFKGTTIAGSTAVVETAGQLYALPVPQGANEKPDANVSLPGFKQADARIKINGQLQQLNNKPTFVQNKIYLPFRNLFELFDANVDYHTETKQITVKSAHSVIHLTPNKSIATVDGKQVQLSEMPFIHEGVTYVPLREAGKLLNADVQWETSTRTVLIQK